jgi:hypothetical protein
MMRRIGGAMPVVWISRPAWMRPKAGHFKLIYRLPAWCGPVRRKQINVEGPAAIDFRCTTRNGNTVQDVLPPSIHPETRQPYQWVGDWQNVPMIPADLLTLWLAQLDTGPVKQTPTGDAPGEDELREALFTLDPDMPRDEWVKVGMALHSADPTADWLFDEWSATGTKYVGHDIGPVWDSFDQTENGVTVATLFRWARDTGWKPSGPSVGEILGLVPTSPSVGAAAIQPHVEAVCGAETPAVLESLSTVLCREIDQLPPFRVADDGLTAGVASILLRAMELPAIDQIGIHEKIRQHTGWTKSELKDSLKDLRRRRRELRAGNGDIDTMIDGYLYVATLNVFLHKESGEILRPEAMIALHHHLSEELRDLVLSGKGCPKVTGVDFDPGQGEYFTRAGATYYNQWKGLASYGVLGDASPWLNHLHLLVPDETEREHLLNWMAFTLQHPSIKINHAVIFGGDQGIGKDTLFNPLMRALGDHAKHIGAEALERDFNEYLCGTKLLVLQESDYGGHREARRIANKMKSVVAAPPETLMINKKNVSQFPIRNVVSVVLPTNELDPIQITHGDRRYFVIASSLRVIDGEGMTTPEWTVYFTQLWAWLDGGGWLYVVAHLLSRDVSRFNPGQRPPMTGAKRDAIEASSSPLEAMLWELFENQSGPFEADITSPDILRKWLCGNEGLNQLVQFGLKDAPGVVTLGRVMRALPVTGFRQMRMRGKQPRFVILRNEEHWGAALPEEIADYLDQHPATANLVPWR